MQHLLKARPQQRSQSRTFCSSTISRCTELMISRCIEILISRCIEILISRCTDALRSHCTEIIIYHCTEITIQFRSKRFTFALLHAAATCTIAKSGFRCGQWIKGSAREICRTDFTSSKSIGHVQNLNSAYYSSLYWPLAKLEHST